MSRRLHRRCSRTRVPSAVAESGRALMVARLGKGPEPEIRSRGRG
jgi:hypothetical protein